MLWTQSYFLRNLFYWERARNSCRRLRGLGVMPGSIGEGLRRRRQGMETPLGEKTRGINSDHLGEAWSWPMLRRMSYHPKAKVLTKLIHVFVLHLAAGLWEMKEIIFSVCLSNAVHSTGHEEGILQVELYFQKTQSEDQLGTEDKIWAVFSGIGDPCENTFFFLYRIYWGPLATFFGPSQEKIHIWILNTRCWPQWWRN